MKNTFFLRVVLFTLSIILISSSGCKRDIEDLELATYPTNGDVFIDGFSGGLDYGAFAGSKVTAFEVDTDITLEGSEASMRIEVPDEGDPQGSYAGGAYFTGGGRDLSGYTVLTFWAKATKSAILNEVGFGNDFGEGKYLVTLNNVPMNTNWKKYYIPIPDPSKLVAERGMFYYAEGPEDGEGYTFWFDEVKFENIETIVNQGGSILLGQDQTTTTETGLDVTIEGLTNTFNLSTGIDQTTNIAPSYFTFSSSVPSIATVSELGVVTLLDQGSSVITATFREADALGSLTVESTGDAVLPAIPAPVPTTSQDSVISMFSNAYNDVPVDVWNTFWEFSTALTDDVQVNGDDIKRYTNLNFVGIEFTSQTIDASEMTHFHMDIWTPSPTNSSESFKILLVDFGADNSFDGGDDSSHELSFTSPTLSTGNWISLDIPFSSFPGLTNRENLAQLVLSGEVPTVFVDNVYFYQGDNTGTGSDEPTVAAPTPSEDPSGVISIFSDTYTNEAGIDFYPDWGQGNVVSEVAIAGNNTLLYSGLDYQGIQLGSNLDVSSMTHLHIDYWTNNSTALNAFLISDGPVETPSILAVPTSGWASVDIPLSDFSPVDLAGIIQLKFDGNGDIYLDNIYFHNE